RDRALNQGRLGSSSKNGETIVTLVTNPVFATMLASFVALAMPAVAADVPSNDTLATSQGDAAIHAFHHAALSIKWNKLNIVADPAPMMGGDGGGESAADAATDFKSAGTPDIILITHEHPDHYNPDVLATIVGDKTVLVVPKDVADKLPDALKGKAKVMNNGDTATVAGVSISAVPAYNTT